MPGDIYLSDAIATSAAAIDHHMGALEGEELFKDLKVTLGIARVPQLLATRGKKSDSIFVFRLVNLFLDT